MAQKRLGKKESEGFIDEILHDLKLLRESFITVEHEEWCGSLQKWDQEQYMCRVAKLEHYTEQIGVNVEKLKSKKETNDE